MKRVALFGILSALAFALSAAAQEHEHSHAPSTITVGSSNFTIERNTHRFIVEISPETVRAGQEAEIQVTIAAKEEAADALLGDYAPFDGNVRGKIEPWGSEEWLVAHAEGEVGKYGWHVTFPKTGNYTFRIRARDDMNVEFPITVSEASKEAPGEHPMEGMMEHRMEGMEHRHMDMMPTGRSFQAGPPVYNLSFWWDKTPEVGRETVFSLRVNETKTGKPLATDDIEIVHEARIHALLARKDLRHFDHVHPKPTDDGATWTLPYTFDAGGEYKFWFDFKPLGADMQVPAFVVHVGGMTPAYSFDGDTSTQKMFGALDVTLTAEPHELRAGEEATFDYTVLSDGKPAALAPYLGAGLHAVVVSEDTMEFGHTHGESPEPGKTSTVHDHATHRDIPVSVNDSGKLRMSYVFPKPGVYKIFGQFMTPDNEKPVTTEFTVLVGEGEKLGSESAAKPESHEHRH